MTAKSPNGVEYLVCNLSGEQDSALELQAMYQQIANYLKENNLSIVHERVFGRRCAASEVLKLRNEIFGESGLSVETPVSWLEGVPLHDGLVAGVIFKVVNSSDVQTVYSDGIPCGSVWTDGDSRFVVLQNLCGAPEDSRQKQTAQMIEKADKILEGLGGSYSDVARTWFYISDILEWYDSFNVARTAVYTDLDIMPTADRTDLLLPASTGISCKNTRNAAATMDLFAVIGPARVTQLSNRKQEEAFNYGSAFSRGALVEASGGRMIQLSGTASIDESGASIYTDSTLKQIECTFNKVSSLIKPHGATLNDICAACLFLKRSEDIDILTKYLNENALGQLPFVCMQADVCRDDLLFEIDGEILF